MYNCYSEKYFSRYKNNKIKFKKKLNFLLKKMEIYGFENKLILDLGCGTGEITKFLSKKFKKCKVFGVDLYFNFEKEKMKTKNTYFVKSDLNSKILPFKEKEFDFILLNDVIEHISNPKGLLNECNRIIKDNGVLLIKTPNSFDLERVFCFFRRNIWYADKDKTHLKYYNFYSLKSELKKVGFENFSFFFGYHTLFGVKINTFIFGPKLVIKCVKKNYGF